jgi:hypothetical protein
MILLQKPSEIEIINNKDIYESFCMAIIGRDLNLIKELLCDKGRFLNRSKMEFLGYLHSLISTLPKVGVCDFDVWLVQVQSAEQVPLSARSRLADVTRRCRVCVCLRAFVLATCRLFSSLEVCGVGGC